MRGAQQLLQQRSGREIQLPTGLQEAEHDALGARPGLGAIATPDFACDHHGPNGCSARQLVASSPGRYRKVKTASPSRRR